MAGKRFDPDLILRNVRVAFEERTDQEMERRIQTVVRNVRREQSKFFTILATQTIGTLNTPAKVDFGAALGPVKGGRVPWETLSDGWRMEKNPVHRDRFFMNTGSLAEQLMAMSPFDLFGTPDYYRGKRLKNDAKYTWTIRLFPALSRRYPQFAGLEKHPKFAASGVGKKFYARPAGGKGKPIIKRPLLQPFLVTWNLRLQKVILRTLGRSNSSREANTLGRTIGGAIE